MKREKLKLKIGLASASSELYSRDVFSACDPGINPLKQGIIEGENPVFGLDLCAYEGCSESRAVWEYSANWVVKFI